MLGGHTALCATALKQVSLKVAVPRERSLGGRRVQDPASASWKEMCGPVE